MSTEPAWLLLRIPRTPEATRMSGVVSAGGYVTTREGPDIPSVCEALVAEAKAAGHEMGAVSLIFPLDGRHGLAHVVLEEAERRGWSFTRHVPRGAEAHLLDLAGVDAAPDSPDVSALFESLTKQTEEAIGDSELGEALAVLRQMLTLAFKHLGAWHPDTLWAASNLLRIGAGTGADANIDQACGLIQHLLAQPHPTSFENPLGLLRKLEEIASGCARSGRTETATHIMEAAITVAREAFGEGHVNHLAVQNNNCQLLAAIQSPRAEPAMRELLRSARAALGDRHANVAVVLSNLADLLESQGRADEAGSLRAEAQAIRAEQPAG